MKHINPFARGMAKIRDWMGRSNPEPRVRHSSVPVPVSLVTGDVPEVRIRPSSTLTGKQRMQRRMKRRQQRDARRHNRHQSRSQN